jgi:hypothetical protein
LVSGQRLSQASVVGRGFLAAAFGFDGFFTEQVFDHGEDFPFIIGGQDTAVDPQLHDLLDEIAVLPVIEENDPPLLQGRPDIHDNGRAVLGLGLPINEDDGRGMLFQFGGQLPGTGNDDGSEVIPF